MKPPIFLSIIVSLCTLFPSITKAEYPSVFSTWNIEWLSTQPNSRFPESQRTSRDFNALRNHFDQINPDVLAFQEVNDLKAIRKIVGNDYSIYLSDRSLPSNARKQFELINQYTGFAVKSGIKYERKEDVDLGNGASSRLRFATYITLEANSKEIHLLSIHLKAGCSGAYKNNKDCRTLKAQGKKLNNWIKARESKGEEYLLLGDFNHNLAYRNDWFWSVMTQGTSAQLATQDTRATCKVRSKKNPTRTHQFRSLIDHIVVSDNVNTTKVNQVNYPTQDVLDYQLSDHCPIKANISFN